MLGLLVGVGHLGAMTFRIAINPNFPHPLYHGVPHAPVLVMTSVFSGFGSVALR
ncbi:hypothetical protein [Streptomyces edwardsiae]|uniref:Uncharacterized protein n=1 Tax=Streptomyces edwardsiae TaxID=3075527 RepID=A0ABU2QPI7_9ACTN|nr:hypothetical protein [Streptomyces sp. DSM 41635]MDT0405918.1 hypothetical protein [Streptomyces sp. DSM 41635]